MVSSVKGTTDLIKTFVDEDQIPKFLGGNSDKKLIDNWGPWNNYDLIDGTQPDDIVGVKHKETGKMFTL